jgi:hypothetical protein
MAQSKWCCQRGSNSRPLPYQGSALPLSYGSLRGRRAGPARRGRLVPQGAGHGKGACPEKAVSLGLSCRCKTMRLKAARRRLAGPGSRKQDDRTRFAQKPACEDGCCLEPGQGGRKGAPRRGFAGQSCPTQGADARPRSGGGWHGGRDRVAGLSAP